MFSLFLWCLRRIFSHPNILPVLGACQAPPSPHPIIITHYMPYGSLFNILHQGTSKLFALMHLYKMESHCYCICRFAPLSSSSSALVVDQSQAVKFALDIASGMAFLHTLEPMVSRLYLNSKHVMVRRCTAVFDHWRISNHNNKRSITASTQLRWCCDSLARQMFDDVIHLQIDEDMTARISMADAKFSFQCPGRMYSPAWMAPEGTFFPLFVLPPAYLLLP